MRPEDIRRLYHQEEAATDAEAADTRRDMETDPEQARNAILAAYAMASEGPPFTGLLNRFLSGALMALIVEEAGRSDAFALTCGKLLGEAMDDMAAQAGARKKPKKRGGRPKRVKEEK